MVGFFEFSVWFRHDFTVSVGVIGLLMAVRFTGPKVVESKGA
jgi:hypothetical protein